MWILKFEMLTLRQISKGQYFDDTDFQGALAVGVCAYEPHFLSAYSIYVHLVASLTKTILNAPKTDF